MDATQVHLFLNYIPLAGMTLGFVLLLLGFWKKNNRFIRIGLAVLAGTALVVLPVFATGEIAGKGAGLLVGPVWTNIANHKSSALPSFAATAVTGVLALIGLIAMFRGSELAQWKVVALLFLSLASVSLTARTTYLGRHIHTADAAAAK